jgi:hypothetical protein
LTKDIAVGCDLSTYGVFAMDSFKEGNEETVARSKRDSARVYKSLSTLCDDSIGLTCSYHIAVQSNLAQKILPHPSFEQAAEAVKNAESDAVLVPAAYPYINAIIMDRALTADKGFVHSIPPLVFAVPSDREFVELEAIFHHPAVTPLLSEIGVMWKKSVLAQSNSQACAMLLSEAGSNGCITNQFCVEHFHLRAVKVLRGGIKMPWICFIKT